MSSKVDECQPLPGGASGSATVTALVNSPPSGGSATLTTNPEASTGANPTELLSVFTTIASAWTDPDGGITYQFLVGRKLEVSPLESTLTPLRGRPSAKAKHSFALEKGVYYMYLKVSDSLGTSTIVGIRASPTDKATATVQVEQINRAALVAVQEARGFLPDSFDPIYFESDSRRRQLLQSGSLGGAPEYSKQEIEVAQQMTQLQWDTAVGTADSDSAYMFIRVFARLYGGDLTNADVIAGLRNVPCSVTVRRCSSTPG